jgi:hypothetical protein
LIRGFIRDEQPFVGAVIALPRASAAVPVDLLVDTGSHLTVLSRAVFEALGVDPVAQFPMARRVRAAGIGGSEDYLRVRVIISFATADPALRPYPIWVAVPVVRDAMHTSILGMDAIVDFRLTVSVREDRVELEPLF